MSAAGLVRQLGVERIKPAPVNAEIYRLPGVGDRLAELTETIKKDGVLTPLTVSRDFFIISGHRRREAGKAAGLKTLPCIVRRDVKSGTEKFNRLLVEANNQREKTLAEIAAEMTVLKSGEEAMAELTAARIRQRRAVRMAILNPNETSLTRQRRSISDVKEAMAAAVIETLTNLESYLPVTLRQLHYRLLNDPPLRNTLDPGSRYQNDRKSYSDLSDLVTRLRVDGRIPVEAITDHTRETHAAWTFASAAGYTRHAVKNMLRDYWRDLQQGQPLHLELVAEKNTVLDTLRPIADRYTVPLTILRGYPSFSALAQMAARISRANNQGKEAARIIAVTDHDPEGEDICRTVERILRRDFALTGEIETVKAALTMEQIRKHRLPENVTVKGTSSRAGGYVCRHGSYAWELEALHPETLQGIVAQKIEQSMDAAAFNAELEKEKQEAVELDAMRQRILAAMGGGE